MVQMHSLSCPSPNVVACTTTGRQTITTAIFRRLRDRADAIYHRCVMCVSSCVPLFRRSVGALQHLHAPSTGWQACKLFVLLQHPCEIYMHMLPVLVHAMSDFFTIARMLRNHNTSRCFTALTPLSMKRCRRASESCTYCRELRREASHDSVHCSEPPTFPYPDPARARN